MLPQIPAGPPICPGGHLESGSDSCLLICQIAKDLSFSFFLLQRREANPQQTVSEDTRWAGSSKGLTVMSAEKYGMVLRQVLQAAELERLFDGLLPPRPSHWLGRDACFIPRAVEPVEMTITPSRSDQVPLFVQQFFMQVRHRGSRQTKRGTRPNTAMRQPECR